MKQRILVVFMFLSLLGCTGISTPRELLSTLPEPVDYTPPHPEQWTLSNGIEVHFIRDAELPIVKGTLYLRAGTLWEKDLKPGIAAALGSQMRLGGTESRTPDELDRELEKLSAGIGTTFGSEYGTVRFGALAPDLERVFALTQEVIRKPRFDPDRFSLWQGQMLEGIRRRSDSPDTIGSIAMQQILYEGSPLGRILVDSHVSSLTRNDLFEAHRRLIRPEGAILAISGDITREELTVLLEKHFGSWKSEAPRVMPEQIMPTPPKGGVYFVRKPFSQASVYAVQHGPQRLTPDYAAIDGFNSIFGANGDFGSLLVKRVRAELGLVYSVAGGIFTGMPVGKNFIGLQTKASSTGQALGAALEVLESVRNGTVEMSMLEDTKRGIANSFVFKFDSADGLVQRQALLTLLNFPETYDDTYVSKITDISVDDIRSVAKSRWDLENLVVVVIGNDEAYRSLMEYHKTGPDYIRALPFREVQFDQKLIL